MLVDEKNAQLRRTHQRLRSQWLRVLQPKTRKRSQPENKSKFSEMPPGLKGPPAFRLKSAIVLIETTQSFDTKEDAEDSSWAKILTASAPQSLPLQISIQIIQFQLN